MNMIVGYELNNYRSFMESALTLVKVIFGEADFGELMEVRSRCFEVLRCLHAIDAIRLQESRSWVVGFSILRQFGPSRETAMLRAGRGVVLAGVCPCGAREAAR